MQRCVKGTTNLNMLSKKSEQGARMKSKHDLVRKVLRESEDGLTVKQITELTKVEADSLSRILATMPDAYIDRWSGPNRGQYSAVWCVVVPPENCPRPTREEL